VDAIRTYGPDDDAAQVAIYNEAAGALPKFKPATLDDVKRRGRDPSFDLSARFVAEVDGRPVGYATYQANGRVSFPWCRKGHEALASPLLAHVLRTMKARGLTRAWVAYRADWPQPLEFFGRHGFEQRRQMVSFVMDLNEMPMVAACRGEVVGRLRPEDMPAVLALAPGVPHVRTAAEMGQHLLQNPYFSPQSVFALRHVGGPLRAVGVVVADPAYAHPRQTDAAMPCFRLGAFGTEGLTTKRLNGLFSFLAADATDVTSLGLELLGHAVARSEGKGVESLGAQVPSDAPHLLRFYEQYFHRQGSFPVLERAL
jgi:hypothetical protein